MILFSILAQRSKQFLLLAATAIMLMGLGAAGSQAQAPRVLANAPAPNKYLTTSRVLQLPVQVDRAFIPQLKEVCLYGKEGAGDWKCMARVAPNALSITFEVPHDGEYALQLVTVDYMGRNFPTDLNTVTPLIVVVNTRQNTAEPVGANPSTQEPPIALSPTKTAEGPGSSTSQEIITTSAAASPMAPTITLPAVKDGSAPLPDAKANEGFRSRRRQYLNSPRVTLDYTINKMGPSGVSKIDVYVTSEQGAGWKRLATIDDPRNHSEVELPGEGIFGIRLVATNGNGFGGKIPEPGDLPSALFEVDLTGPELKVDITPVNKNGTMDIHWQVSDKNLSSEPIQILYASQSGGPWQLVASVPNDGSYHWVLPRGMPENFIIRVEARDLAGNVSRADCPNPVPLDLTEPEVNLVGLGAVRPVTSDTGR